MTGNDCGRDGRGRRGGAISFTVAAAYAQAVVGEACNGLHRREGSAGRCSKGGRRACVPIAGVAWFVYCSSFRLLVIWFLGGPAKGYGDMDALVGSANVDIREEIVSSISLQRFRAL